MPATPEVVADCLGARGREQARRASIAKIHQLLDLTDPTPVPLVNLCLAAIRRETGKAQKQARPLRFKGLMRDAPRGLIFAR